MIVWDEFRFGWYIAWEKPSIVRFQKASWPCRHHHGHHVGRARATLYSMGRSVSVQLRPWIGLTLVAKRGNVSTMWREYRVFDVTDVHLICLTENATYTNCHWDHSAGTSVEELGRLGISEADWEAGRSLMGQQFDWTQNSAMLVVFWIIMCSNWEEQDRFVGRLEQYTRIFKWQMVLVGKWHLTALEADSYCWNVEGWWGRKEQVVAISFGRCILNCHQLCKNFPFQDRELCGIAFRY